MSVLFLPSRRPSPVALEPRLQSPAPPAPWAGWRHRPSDLPLLRPSTRPRPEPGSFETRCARRHGRRPPPPAGERAASGGGVRPGRALPGAGRAAQTGGAGGRQPGGGHVSGRALCGCGCPGSCACQGDPSAKARLGALSLTCALRRETWARLPS